MRSRTLLALAGTAAVTTALAVPAAAATTYTISVGSTNANGKPAGGSFRPFLDGDGGELVFMSNSPKLGVPAKQQQSFLHNTVTGVTTMISVASDGTMANGTSNHPQISADGSCVVFQSQATNLDPNYATHGALHVYVHWVSGPNAGITRLVDTTPSGVLADKAGQKPTVSGDCRYVAFESKATNLVPNPTLKNFVARKDLTTGAIDAVSIANNGTVGSGFRPSIDADGQRVAFYGAGNLAGYPTAGVNQVYLRDFTTATPRTSLVSISADGSAVGSGASMHPSISPDGGFIGYDSHAKNLVTGFTGTNANIFLYNVATGTTTLVSHVPGNALQAGNGDSLRPSLANGGNYIEYYTQASDIVTGDTNGDADGVRWTQATDTNQLTSVSNTGTQGTNGRTIHIGISGDGQTVAMESTLQNLVAGVTGSQIYLGHFSG